MHRQNVIAAEISGFGNIKAKRRITALMASQEFSVEIDMGIAEYAFKIKPDGFTAVGWCQGKMPAIPGGVHRQKSAGLVTVRIVFSFHNIIMG